MITSDEARSQRIRWRRRAAAKSSEPRRSVSQIARDVLAAKAALVEAGANLMGLVYSGAAAPVIAIERMLRQAG